MGKLIDLTGQRFGHLTVIERGDDYISPSGIPTPKWKCQCDCGNIVDVESRSLRYGKTKSCGCSKGELISLAISEDLTGQKFNRLTVIKRGEDLICKSRNVIRWLCRCECGNETLVTTSSLKSGKTKSCGCLQKEITSSKCLDNLIGRTYGKLTVINRDENKHGKTYWKCKCECGNIVTVNSYCLKSGQTKSCGCINKELMSEKFLDDLTGQRFGRLTVIERAESRKQPKGGRSTRWLCQCDCGNVVLVNASTLKNGESKSCGCIKSYGEIKIIQWLKDHNIEYIPQKRFNGLVGIGGGKLSYDFYIPQYNILIEVQGIQHERPIDYFGGEKQFAIQQEHDELKRKYAKNNNFDLLEIWYYDYDRIEEILNKKLEVV